MAVDAFSQALTTPLLSEHVFKESTFSPTGWAALNGRDTVDAMVRRPNGAVDGPITMTRSGGGTAADAPRFPRAGHGARLALATGRVRRGSVY